MELEPVSPIRPVAKTYQIPPDVNTGDTLLAQQRWYSRLAIRAPAVYGIHFLLLLIFGTLFIVFVVLSFSSRERMPFWEMFSEFASALLSLTLLALGQYILGPKFWRARARQAVNEGYFDSTSRTKGGRMLVLEIGCSDGSTSAAFAKAIIDRQRDVGDFKAPYASLPIFIGYDKWSPWSRLPNTPACFLSTLMQAGVPRDCIVANRMDTTSKESKTRLPYPSGSISLVICNIGLSELATKREDRTMLFQELVRVLEPEGRMVIVEKGPVGTRSKRSFWRGQTSTYRDILVEQMGWGRERVTTPSHMCIKYLVAVKPSGTSETV
jgi:SAM-dependent methyltransferase